VTQLEAEVDRMKNRIEASKEDKGRMFEIMKKIVAKIEAASPTQAKVINMMIDEEVTRQVRYRREQQVKQQQQPHYPHEKMDSLKTYKNLNKKRNRNDSSPFSLVGVAKGRKFLILMALLVTTYMFVPHRLF